jgi:hypothetical protein
MQVEVRADEAQRHCEICSGLKKTVDGFEVKMKRSFVKHSQTLPVFRIHDLAKLGLR